MLLPSISHQNPACRHFQSLMYWHCFPPTAPTSWQARQYLPGLSGCQQLLSAPVLQLHLSRAWLQQLHSRLAGQLLCGCLAVHMALRHC